MTRAPTSGVVCLIADMLPDSAWRLIMEYADLNTRHVVGSFEELACASVVNEERREAELICRATRVGTCSTMMRLAEAKAYLGWDTAEVTKSANVLGRSSAYTHAWNSQQVLNSLPNVMQVFGEEVQVPGVDFVDVYGMFIAPPSHFQLARPSSFLSKTIVVPVDILEHDELPEERRVAVQTERRNFSFRLKAHLLMLMIMGKLNYAHAAEQQRNKYKQLMDVLGELVMRAVMATLDCVVRLWNGLSFDWYYNMDPVVQAVFDVALCVWVLWMGIVCTRDPMRIVAPKEKGRTRFIGKFNHENGILYRVEIDGKKYDLTHGGETTESTYEEEMAMPGSEYFPCKSKPVGAIMVANSENDLTVFAVFFRLDDYFITARHCAYALNETTASVYLCPLRETKHKNFEADTSRTYSVPDGFFDPTRNAVGALHVDVFASYLEEDVWARIRVGKAVAKLPSLYNQQVQTVGFTPNGLLVSASGKTLEGSGIEALHHTASTQKGFSGSPLMCGTSVVGVHIAAEGKHNVAVRRELIEYLISLSEKQEARRAKYYTYADAAYKEEFRRHKWRGGLYSVVDYGRTGTYAIELKNGECTYGWNMGQLAEAFGPYESLEKNYDYVEDMLWSNNRRTGRSDVRFEDECNQEALKAEIWDELEPGKRVHAPKPTAKQPEIMQALEEHMTEVVSCGYDPTVYQFPEMSAEMEERSLFSHIEIAANSRIRPALEPTELEIERCAQLVASMLDGAEYMPDPDYDELSGVLRVINSSVVQPRKSPGYPYLENNQSTNAQVLKHYGESGFAQHVINEWDEPFIMRWFLKMEPNKAKKIAQGRPRGLTGFPLHKTVKHASVFGNFNRALVENWRDLPVKVGYSPGNPGDIANLKKAVPGRTWSSDKEVWDWHAKEFHFRVLTRVMQLKAIKHPKMTDEKFEKYLSVDIPNSVSEIHRDVTLQLSNGRRIKMKLNDVMRSGAIITLSGNSVMQIVHHVMIMMRLRYEDDDIVGKMIFAAGDDVEQEPAHDDVKQYCDISASLGVPMTIAVRDGLECSEFFSADLRLDEMGRWQFFPQRFTKHIENLMRIKKDNLAGALANYMGDHRHDPKKYNLYLTLYHRLRKDHPGLFPLSFVKSRQALLAAQYGYDC